jgi:hypothetical protein
LALHLLKIGGERHNPTADRGHICKYNSVAVACCHAVPRGHAPRLFLFGQMNPSGFTYVERGGVGKPALVRGADEKGNYAQQARYPGLEPCLQSCNRHQPGVKGSYRGVTTAKNGWPSTKQPDRLGISTWGCESESHCADSAVCNHRTTRRTAAPGGSGGEADGTCMELAQQSGETKQEVGFGI